MKMSLSDKVWFYVNRQVDVYHVLPSFDEIFDKFECDTSIIREAVESVVGCTDMEGVKIEGEIA
jgi:hypothetical protein